MANNSIQTNSFHLSRFLKAMMPDPRMLFCGNEHNKKIFTALNQTLVNAGQFTWSMRENLYYYLCVEVYFTLIILITNQI